MCLQNYEQCVCVFAAFQAVCLCQLTALQAISVYNNPSSVFMCLQCLCVDLQNSILFVFAGFRTVYVCSIPRRVFVCVCSIASCVHHAAPATLVTVSTEVADTLPQCVNTHCTHRRTKM